MRDYSHAANVTPNDSVDLATIAWAFMVGVTGPVKVTTFWGDTVIVQCIAGYLYKIRTKRVWAASTSATGIVALW